MDDNSFLKINDPLEFRDTLNEGINYSRSQSNYRFKIIRIIRYFLKKPKILLLTKCGIGFVLVLLPIIGVIITSICYSITFLPLLLSESLSISICLFLFIQKLYDDNKYKLNISPYWVRKAYYDMFHFIFVHSFLLWIVAAIYQFNLYLNTLSITNNNDPTVKNLKGCILIKLVLILKYHDNTLIKVGRYSSSNTKDFFSDIQEEAQKVFIPLLILGMIMLGKSIIIRIKYTIHYIGIVFMIVLSCVILFVDHYCFYDKEKSYNEWFNYLHMLPPLIALLFYGALMWKITNDGIKKRKIYDFGDNKPLYVTKLTVEFLFGVSIFGCLCVTVSLICFIIVPITNEFSYGKIETVFYIVLGGVGGIAFGSVFFVGEMMLGMIFKPFLKEYGRKQLNKQFYIYYKPRTKQKGKTMRNLLKVSI